MSLVFPGFITNNISGGTPALTLPTTNLILALDARSGITTTGSGVSAWADQSAAGNDAVQTTDADRPLSATNATLGAVVRFDSSNTEWMDLSGLTTADGSFTAYFVYEPTANTAQQFFLDFSSTRTIVRMRDGSALGYYVNGGYKSGVSLSLAVQVVRVTVNEGTGVQWHRNGASIATTAYVDAIAPAGGTVDLGKSNVNTSYLDADVAAIFMYDGAHDATAAAAVEAYITQEWGV